MAAISATSISPPTPLSFLILSLLVLPSPSATTASAQVAVGNISTFSSSATCSATTQPSAGAGLKISHKYGPCSPLNANRHPSAGELLLEDELQLALLQREQLGSSPLLQSPGASLPTRRGLDLHTTSYVVTVGVGTPSKNQVVVLSTGSSLSWIQCRPCFPSCYEQLLPLFEPSASSSYRNISCSAPACGEFSSRSCAANTGSCHYSIRYGDGSSTEGLLVEEALRLSPNDFVPKFVMGCGNNNRGDFGETSGVLDLSRAPMSLVSQTTGMFGGVFSYCLPVSPSGTGELRFGKAGIGSALYTPMVNDDRAPDNYVVELTAISVGGRVVRSAGASSKTRMIVQPNAIVTRFPPSVYAALRTAFRGGMAEYKLGERLGQLDTCYDMTGKSEFRIPVVALHFRGGAVVELPVVSTMFLGGEDHVCLAFAAGGGGESGLGVLGTIQQRSVQVVYDAGGSRIGFGRGSCSGL